VTEVDRIGPASHHILRIAAACDFLAALGDGGGLLESTLSMADEHVLEELVRLGKGGGAVRKALLRLEGGLRSQVAVDPMTVQVLSELDGERTLSDVFAEVDRATNGGSPGEFARAAMPGIKRLLELGFVVPAR
jgi:hypothetical protein